MGTTTRLQHHGLDSRRWKASTRPSRGAAGRRRASSRPSSRARARAARKSRSTTTMPWATPARVIGPRRGSRLGLVAARCGDDGGKRRDQLSRRPSRACRRPRSSLHWKRRSPSRVRASTPSRGATGRRPRPSSRPSLRRRRPPRRRLLKNACAARPPRREASRSATRLPAPPATSAATARPEGRSGPRAPLGLREGVARRAGEGAKPSPFLEYHNKKSISPGAPAAPEAVPEKPRQRPPPRPALADATQTLDPHAPRAELRAALRKLRPLAAAAAAALGRRLGAGPRALRRGRRDAAVFTECRAR